MQGLAEFIMRGRRQATLVVGLSVAVPLLFWFGAVVLALVLLRRGWSEGMSVVVWGALPALAWALIGDPTPLLVLLGSAALALLLRQRSEWSLVVMATAPLGLVFALLFRVVLILAAQWVLNFRPLMAAGAVYLLWLCLNHFLQQGLLHLLFVS